jgi:predicted helicase
MRQSLMKSFNDIFILDLHGNSLKKERCPDGSKDENVFDIRQGTAIALFIKQSAKEPADKKGKNKNQNVFHSEIWGTREKKYEWLLENDIHSTNWNSLSPKSEFYLYIPRDERLLKVYEKSPKITDIFPVNSVGIVTARDSLTIHWTPEKVWTTILNFSKMDENFARLTYNLGKDVRDWKVKLAQKDLIDSGLDREKIVPILYRPFDIRYTYYTGKSRGFHCMPRKETIRYMLFENLALCVGRAGQVVGTEKPWNIVYCSKFIEDFNLFYRGGSANFPLYLYPDPDKRDLFSGLEQARSRQPNIKPQLFATLSQTYPNKPTPEEIFYYIYAVLYANEYRTKYAEFLRIDFPRVPFTKDFELFQKMGAFGQRLADLHLLESADLDPLVAKFQGTGKNIVDKLKYNQNESRVYINSDQYFEGIEKAVWEYQFGGYQVCNKWLKDRKGRILSLEEIKHYCKVVTAIQKTIETQKDIDTIYSETEKALIEF